MDLASPFSEPCLKLSDAFLIPFALQGLAMMVDEFYFHHKRGLPRWERWGHPLDTLTVLGCFLFLYFVPFSATAAIQYSVLAVFSCVFVTKDEAVHLKHCSAAENWLHSLLFILHPLVFIAAGLIWASSSIGELALLTPHLALLKVQSWIIGLFLIYQIGYWNLYAKNHGH